MRWALIIGVVLVIFTLFAVLGCVNITKDGEKLGLQMKDGRVVTLRTDEVLEKNELRAMVKGSIYSTGEFVSVFGTCTSVLDQGIADSWGSLSAWYPNGTQAVVDVNMTQMQAGYFVYTGYMLPVQGTYLTEFTCHMNSSPVIAKAFGEWQNPQWVQWINDTKNAVANLSNNTENWFNITWSQITSVNATINQSFTNLSLYLEYVASVANGSVDRNDSYLAELLRGIAVATGAPITGYLNTTLDYKSPVYFRNWKIEARVLNEYEQYAGAPLIGCRFSSNNNPPDVNVSMDFMDRNSNGNGAPQEPYFYIERKITIFGPLNFTVNCSYNPVI